MSCCVGEAPGCTSADVSKVLFKAAMSTIATRHMRLTSGSRGWRTSWIWCLTQQPSSRPGLAKGHWLVWMLQAFQRKMLEDGRKKMDKDVSAYVELAWLKLMSSHTCDAAAMSVSRHTRRPIKLKPWEPLPEGFLNLKTLERHVGITSCR